MGKPQENVLLYGLTLRLLKKWKSDDLIKWKNVRAPRDSITKINYYGIIVQVVNWPRPAHILMRLFEKKLTFLKASVNIYYFWSEFQRKTLKFLKFPPICDISIIPLPPNSTFAPLEKIKTLRLCSSLYIPITPNRYSRAKIM